MFMPAAEAAASLWGAMEPPHPGRRPLHRRAYPSREKIRPPLEKPVFSGTLASGRPLQVLASKCPPNSEIRESESDPENENPRVHSVAKTGSYGAFWWQVAWRAFSIAGY